MMFSASLGGLWAIEVSPLTSSIGSGNCKLEWQVGNEVEDITIAYDQGRFPSCGNSYFLDIGKCVNSNLLKNPGVTINVDCSEIEGDKTISLIYNSGNSYYILSSEEASEADVIVNNGCFGLGESDSTCRKEATLYANWAASLMDSTIDTNLYLMEKYEEDSALDNALLYLTTKDPEYLVRLKDIQKVDGSFDRDLKMNALAFIAMKGDSVTYDVELTMAKEWLKTKQQEEGNFGTAADTAAILYAAFSDDIGLPPEEIDDSDGGIIDSDVCEVDGYCDEFAGEDEYNCPDDCFEEEQDDGGYDACIVNGECETEYEDSDNCPEDCTCGDDVCDDVEKSDGTCPDDCGESDNGDDQNVKDAGGDGYCDEFEEDATTCPADCEEGGSSFGTIIIIIIILMLIGGGFFAYKQGWIKPKSKTPSSPFARPGYSFKPGTPSVPSTLGKKPAGKPIVSARPSVFRSPATNARKDDELSKSLEEAKKLLGK